MKKSMYPIICSLMILGSMIPCSTLQAQDTLYLEEIATGLSEPVFVTSPPNDDRLFILEQTGKILIYKDDSVLTEPFLDITSRIIYNNELGLLGLTFHPDYATNGYFYVNYTFPVGNDNFSRLSRFSVLAGTPDAADSLSEDTLLELDQPFNNHNGGMLAFGPDGYLYAGFGDGGGFGDPQDNGQDTLVMFGKILRLDVDNGSPYGIPADNPFVGNPNKLDEIWVLGLRNPWRFSFDRLTGDLYIGDVGQNVREEISFQSASSSGGENYGWRLKEGTACYNPSSNCENGVTLEEPIFDYTHSGFNPPNCSVTGGYVYRGSCLPEFAGRYFFGDYCSGRIWSIRYANGQVIDTIVHVPSVPSAPFATLASFGEDANGEMYLVYLNGTIFRVVPEGGSSQCSTENCCEGIRGNIDNSSGSPQIDDIDISDLVYIVNYSFGNPNGPAPVCDEEADLNSDNDIDISDIVYLVNYMFGDPSGPAPLSCA